MICPRPKNAEGLLPTKCRNCRTYRTIGSDHLHLSTWPRPPKSFLKPSDTFTHDSFPGLCNLHISWSVGNVCFCASFLKQSERDGQALVWALVEFSLRRNNSERIGSPRQAYHHLPWQEGAGGGRDKSQHRDFCCSYYFLLWITISIGREWKILLHSYLLLCIGTECWYRALSVK